MSIFSDITKWVKGWRLDKFLEGVANGDQQAGEALHATTEKAVELVELVKGYLQSPTAGVITAIIPGEWDNELRDKAEAFLEKAKNKAALISDCGTLPTAGEQLVCTYNKIVAAGDDNTENDFWHSLGILATQVFADGKIGFGDAAVAAEFVYRLIVKKKPVIE